MSKVTKTMQKKLAKLAVKPETDIDFSDIPATKETDWQHAIRGQFYKPVKQQLTVRIDADIIAWLKAQGERYQSRLNEILRAAMLKQLKR